MGAPDTSSCSPSPSSRRRTKREASTTSISEQPPRVRQRCTEDEPPAGPDIDADGPLFVSSPEDWCSEDLQELNADEQPSASDDDSDSVEAVNAADAKRSNVQLSVTVDIEELSTTPGHTTSSLAPPADDPEGPADDNGQLSQVSDVSSYSVIGYLTMHSDDEDAQTETYTVSDSEDEDASDDDDSDQQEDLAKEHGTPGVDVPDGDESEILDELDALLPSIPCPASSDKRAVDELTVVRNPDGYFLNVDEPVPALLAPGPDLALAPAPQVAPNDLDLFQPLRVIAQFRRVSPDRLEVHIRRDEQARLCGIRTRVVLGTMYSDESPDCVLHLNDGQADLALMSRDIDILFEVRVRHDDAQNVWLVDALHATCHNILPTLIEVEFGRVAASGLGFVTLMPR